MYFHAVPGKGARLRGGMFPDPGLGVGLSKCLKGRDRGYLQSGPAVEFVERLE